ncbi:hypothetical protein GCM10011416_00900 [Polaribacter pacificus]|uniref:Uncharacterized protein n=1 Tax=Polaribacter pacificus TaxID=1775173 RepID=A0A917HS56_9FLAO|nr:hypothetical protein [Polaribacter pacificus]GGG88453.1 hypothetical protein GCM10011416_00900 [Polaribacter pacificus]
MTFQIRDIITYKGEENYMTTLPLDQYLKNKKDINFIFQNTACWHCYQCKWELSDKMLFLTNFSAKIDGGKDVGLNYLFPNKKIVFANWFTGEIRIQMGEVLEYRNFNVIHEKDLIIQFKKGVLISERETNNEEDVKKRKIEHSEIVEKKLQKKSTIWGRFFGKKNKK